MTRLLIITLTVFVSLTWLGAGEAKAAWPCTWAPGEYQVGEDRGVPLCERDESLVQRPTQPVYVATNYYAAAWHGESPVVWMVAGYGSVAAAEASALDKCKKAMGKGCTIAQSNFNGAFVSVIGMNGQLYAATDTTRKKAEKRALEHCAKQKDICAVNTWMEAPAGNQTPFYTPPKGDPRNVYAAVAWPKEPVAATKEDLTIYVSTGHATLKAAETGVLDFCKSQTGKECVLIHTIASTYFVMVKRSDDQVSVEGSPTEDLAKKVVKERCPKGLKCTMTGIIPAWQGGNIAHKPFAP